jgi:hypothetical protein
MLISAASSNRESPVASAARSLTLRSSDLQEGHINMVSERGQHPLRVFTGQCRYAL